MHTCALCTHSVHAYGICYIHAYHIHMLYTYISLYTYLLLLQTYMHTCLYVDLYTRVCICVIYACVCSLTFLKENIVECSFFFFFYILHILTHTHMHIYICIYIHIPTFTHANIHLLLNYVMCSREKLFIFSSSVYIARYIYSVYKWYISHTRRDDGDFSVVLLFFFFIKFKFFFKNSFTSDFRSASLIWFNELPTYSNIVWNK